MTNPFRNRTPALQGPATDIMPVIPDDNADFSAVAIALYPHSPSNLLISLS